MSLTHFPNRSRTVSRAELIGSSSGNRATPAVYLTGGRIGRGTAHRSAGGPPEIGRRPAARWAQADWQMGPRGRLPDGPQAERQMGRKPIAR